MKIEIKRKIIRIVKSLINYSPAKDEGLKVPVPVRKIKRAKIDFIYTDEEIKKIDKGQIEFGLGLKLLNNLREEKLIKFTYDKVPEGTIVRVVLTIIE